jgi:hypothetical protein
MPLKRSIESPFPGSSMKKVPSVTNINKDFEEEDSVEATSQLSPATRLTLSTEGASPETEVPVIAPSPEKGANSKSDLRVKTHLSSLNDKATMKHVAWTSFFMGASLVGVLVYMILLIQSNIAIRRDTKPVRDASVGTLRTELPLALKALPRKRLLVSSSGLPIKLINAGDESNKVYWNRGFFGELGMFDGLFGGRAKIASNGDASR